MATAAYGTYAPQEDQPSAMENTLAHLAYSGYSDSPAEAQTALDQYWLERQLNKQDYAAQLQEQHKYAYDQLQQQLYEANLKGLYEAGKTPGMLQLIAHSPQYAGVLGGADAGTINDVINQQLEGQQAVNLGHTGSFLSGAAAGGHVFPTLTNLPGMGGQDSSRYIGTPAEINAAARLAAAKLKAAGDMAVATAPGYSIALPESYGQGSTITGKLNPNAAEAQIRQLNQFRANLANTPQPTATTSEVPLPVNPSKFRIASGGGTNLPPAPQDTGGVGTQQPVNNFSIVPTTDQATINRAKMALDSFKRSNPQAFAKMAPRGPVPTVVKDNKTGQLYVQGSDGQHYPIR